MNDNVIEKLIDHFHAQGLSIKRISSAGVEIEFFPPLAPPMDLDPVSLSKTLAESMPPDSAMLFASTEDPAPEPTLNHSDGKNEPMA